MIKQFNFYKSYMDNIASLSHAEAGQYIKKLLDFMFRDKEPDELSTDKVTCLFLLLSDGFKAEKERELSSNNTPIVRGRRFTFRSIYANIFFCLKDSEAGILIKQICGYMFGEELVTDEECTVVKSYFLAIKVPLSKSKCQSERVAKQSTKQITLETIRKDFPFITGNLRADNRILEGVDMRGLYEYIMSNKTELNGLHIYNVIAKYRENLHAE